MNRREFLRAAGLAGGAAMLGGSGLLACSDGSSTGGRPSATHVPRLPLPSDSMLGHPSTESPIDTVVVLMMENRSFDHYLGWLGHDEGYLDDGRRRYGKDFNVNARLHERYRDPSGVEVPTRYALTLSDDSSPYRGCDHLGPGHSWDAGRAQRDFGFLAPGTHNDNFATSYYLDHDVPVHAQMARRFTVLDRHHASLLGPTFPNRMYLYSAQSEGLMTSPVPVELGMYRAPTILDALDRAGVPTAEYFVDLPTALLWGPRMFPFVRRIDAYFEDANAGTLPNVTFADAPVRRAVQDRRPPARHYRARAAVHRCRLRCLPPITTVATRRVRARLRRVGWLLRSRASACRAGCAVELRRSQELRADGLPRAVDRGVSVRTTGIRRPQPLRPRVDHQVPGVAISRCPCTGPWPARRPLVPDQA
jgi:hypothetical protein